MIPWMFRYIYSQRLKLSPSYIRILLALLYRLIFLSLGKVLTQCPLHFPDDGNVERAIKNGLLPGKIACNARCVARSSISPNRLWTSRCAYPGAVVAFVATVFTLSRPAPLWIMYGGLLRSTPVSFAAPRPRLVSVVELAFWKVSVPLMVMFPLGPEIAWSYLQLSNHLD